MINGVTMCNISKRFGTKEALTDVTLNVQEGEVFGLLGPSGAGKTTIIKILTGQLKSTSGTAAVLGRNVTQIDHSVYSQIGTVLDNSGLYERLSCYDNLAMFARLHMCPFSRIGEVLKQVGLEEAKKTPAGKLSKGMTQRLVLARAILHKPKLLFLDEPTSGLDPVTMDMIHSLIRDLQSTGTVVFMTTHNMEEATKMCHHVALLNDGKIVEYGNPEDICRKHNQNNEITIITKANEEITLINNPDNAAAISQYFASDNVRAIHSSEPDLASVFIKVTGRTLV